ncbi:MAG: hypothetical protein IJ200_13275 [Prevotella sp.]|nr:hypothetical protein [Prevotella sp.]
MKLKKKTFTLAFFATVAVLAVLRPYVEGRGGAEADGRDSTATAEAPCLPDGGIVPHRIYSVPDYHRAFPDSQAVQIVAAEQWGVEPVRNRADAEARKRELVYVGESPYYHVDPLASSIPYLVPRAALLLSDIGQAFYDSLYVKGIPLQQLRVTSVLRTVEDVEKLRRYNGNATERSCHLFGTTFDISYNRYHAVARPVRDDTLKWVLCEVLRDKRAEGRCYVKYEVKQGCFHMTVR